MTSLVIMRRHLSSRDIICHHETSLVIVRRHLSSRDVTCHHATSLVITRRHLSPRDVSTSRVTEPLEVSGPVLPPRHAVRARAGEERVVFKGVGVAREDVDGVGLAEVLGPGVLRPGVLGPGVLGPGVLGPRAQGRQLALLLLGDGRGGGEVVLEQRARRHGVRVEAEARGGGVPAARQRGRRRLLRLEHEPATCFMARSRFSL